jgi:hypothetical protein
MKNYYNNNKIFNHKNDKNRVRKCPRKRKKVIFFKKNKKIKKNFLGKRKFLGEISLNKIFTLKIFSFIKKISDTFDDDNDVYIPLKLTSDLKDDNDVYIPLKLTSDLKDDIRLSLEIISLNDIECDLCDCGYINKISFWSMIEHAQINMDIFRWMVEDLQLFSITTDENIKKTFLEFLEYFLKIVVLKIVLYSYKEFII